MGLVSVYETEFVFTHNYALLLAYLGLKMLSIFSIAPQ